jgi:hypothetical protein
VIRPDCLSQITYRHRLPGPQHQCGEQLPVLTGPNHLACPSTRTSNWPSSPNSTTRGGGSTLCAMRTRIDTEARHHLVTGHSQQAAQAASDAIGADDSNAPAPPFMTPRCGPKASGSLSDRGFARITAHISAYEERPASTLSVRASLKPCDFISVSALVHICFGGRRQRKHHRRPSGGLAGSSLTSRASLSRNAAPRPSRAACRT